MTKLINRTKQIAKSFDSLSHYLWNEIMKVNENQNEFNLFSPFSWLTIFGWIFLLLTAYDCKCYILPDSIHTVAFGHRSIGQ